MNESSQGLVRELTSSTSQLRWEPSPIGLSLDEFLEERKESEIDLRGFAVPYVRDILRRAIFVHPSAQG